MAPMTNVFARGTAGLVRVLPAVRPSGADTSQSPVAADAPAIPQAALSWCAQIRGPSLSTNGAMESDDEHTNSIRPVGGHYFGTGSGPPETGDGSYRPLAGHAGG